MIESYIAELVCEHVTKAVHGALDGYRPPVDTHRGIQLMTIKDAADAMAVSEATIRRMIAIGDIPAVRCFSSLRIDSRDLARYIDRAKEVKDEG